MKLDPKDEQVSTVERILQAKDQFETMWKWRCVGSEAWGKSGRCLQFLNCVTKRTVMPLTEVRNMKESRNEIL